MEILFLGFMGMNRQFTSCYDCGIQIKLESKGGMHSSLMFCTTGVLLRKIVNADPKDVINYLNATHIIVVCFSIRLVSVDSIMLSVFQGVLHVLLLSNCSSK